MDSQPAPIVQEKVHRYLCPGCAADLVFEPKGGCLECPYCGRREQIPASAEQVEERSYEAYLRQPPPLSHLSENAREVQCGGCGASVTFTPPQVAGQCAFCGAKIVAQSKSADPVVAPAGILPFRVAQADAVGAVRTWLAGRWFAPNALKQAARQESIQGIYLPFWTYDAFTVSHYNGERGEYYWETQTFTDRDSQGRSVTRRRQVRKTRWYPSSGTVSRWFDDILIAATVSLPRQRLAELEPWDLSELKSYEPAYLAGYRAQHYQTNLVDGFEQAKPIIAAAIDAEVRRDIGGDEQQVHQVATSYSAITFKHLLLPVYISAYEFHQKIYQVMINARTGEVQGDRPYSALKVGLFVLFLVLISILVLYFVEE